MGRGYFSRGMGGILRHHLCHAHRIRTPFSLFLIFGLEIASGKWSCSVTAIRSLVPEKSHHMLLRAMRSAWNGRPSMDDVQRLM
ncbi:hypothetical protein Pyn_21931 [Prunus yedoensis var. nudiflora]|uniref:Uncharacterized protein n=1 Tax=Prunus yedoensis var. nudiflora TaxID=2094558 RepID=A0A314XLB9_PRUYE|nr:hypothetical protein Pyn_21931 [Prunus yedoensis var. nudiflora]